MLIYFTIVTIPLIAHFFRFSLKGRKIENIIVLLLAIFFCFGYMTGSDWRQYETFYDWIDTSDPMYACFVEPGYHLTTVLFKFLGFDFWTFLILAKLFCFFVAIRFIKKTIPEYFFLALFIYLCLFCSYLYIDNPLRNLLALSIFLLSIDYIKTNRLVPFLICISICVLIHISSALLIPLYFFVNKRFSSKSIIIAYIFVNILFTFFVDQIFSFIISLQNILPFYADKVSIYFVEESNFTRGRAFSLGYITKIMLFILFMLSRKKIENRFGILFFNFIIVYLILYKLGLTIQILARFSLYLSIFYCIGVTFLITSFQKQSKLFYTLFILFISYSSLFVTITANNKYIPYSNYLFYIFKEKPDFNYRSDYNAVHSPYKEEEGDAP